MKILITHNRYRHAGGEDSVMEDELDLLRSHGHEVRTLSRDNLAIENNSRLGVGVSAIWSVSACKEVAELCRSFKPDVLHSHNTFPLLSPSIYWAAAKAGVPVVQTLHNFRLMCANAMFTRQGKTCEQCLGKLPWRGVVNQCYRESTVESLALVAMLGVHRALGSFQHKVTRYIALNQFCRNKFIEGGLPADRICIKPNFSPDPQPSQLPRSGVLFVGRLTAEKGLATLLEAATLAQQRITVIGVGPMAADCIAHPLIDYRGQLSRAEVLGAMQRASCLVVPSIWYENMPRTVVEAFACGLPVIASRIGALAEMVEHGRTGLLFDTGVASSLAQCLQSLTGAQATLATWSAAARATYEQHYTAGASHTQLVRIYDEAIAAMKQAPGG